MRQLGGTRANHFLVALEVDDDLAEKERQAEVVHGGELRRIRPGIRLAAVLDDGLGHALRVHAAVGGQTSDSGPDRLVGGKAPRLDLLGIRSQRAAERLQQPVQHTYDHRRFF